MNNVFKEMRLMEIENELKKAESQKTTAVIMMVASLIVLWPLLIVGIIQYSNANKKIERLNEEKKSIMFQDYFNGNNQH